MHTWRFIYILTNTYKHQRTLTTTPRCPYKVTHTSITCQYKVSVRWWWITGRFHRAQPRKYVCMCMCIHMYPMLLEKFVGFASGDIFNVEVNCQSQSAWKSHVKVKCDCSYMWQLHKGGLLLSKMTPVWHCNGEDHLIYSSVNYLNLPCFLKFSFDVNHVSLHRKRSIIIYEANILL